MEFRWAGPVALEGSQYHILEFGHFGSDGVGIREGISIGNGRRHADVRWGKSKGLGMTKGSALVFSLFSLKSHQKMGGQVLEAGRMKEIFSLVTVGMGRNLAHGDPMSGV